MIFNNHIKSWRFGLSQVLGNQEKRVRRIGNTLSELRTQLTPQLAKRRGGATGFADRQAATAKTSGGFTVVELVVGITVGSILFMAFMVAISNQFVLIVKNNANIDMSTTAQNLLRSTTESIRGGDGIRQTNSIADPNSPGGGWNTSNSNFVVVIETPALDSSHNYIIDPNTGDPYMNELVYYKSGISLYERQLANPNAAGNSLKTSCPPGHTSASCPADPDLGDYFSSMDFTLYDQDNASTTDPLQARLIKINLSMQRTVFGEKISLSSDIAVTLRNRF